MSQNELTTVFISISKWHKALLLQDKTFGLKNKKGGKAQKFIAQVEKQVKTGGDPRLQKLEAERAAEKKKKEDEKKAEDEKNLLFRPVQKIEAGKRVIHNVRHTPSPVLNVGHCQGDQFKVPFNSLERALFNCNRLSFKRLGLWILAAAMCLQQGLFSYFYIL